MTTEQLPEGLNIAVEIICEYVESIIIANRHPVTGELPPHAEIDQQYGMAAIAVIRAEHARCITLQHHAADQAQRIADLIRYSDEGIAQAQASLQERIALARVNRSQAQRIADLESENGLLARGLELTENKLKLEQGVAKLCAEERDALRAKVDACRPHLRERLDGSLESPADMLALREQEVLGLLGRLIYSFPGEEVQR